MINLLHTAIHRGNVFIKCTQNTEESDIHYTLQHIQVTYRIAIIRGKLSYRKQCNENTNVGKSGINHLYIQNSSSPEIFSEETLQIDVHKMC